jgi:hypothetical protein
MAASHRWLSSVSSGPSAASRCATSLRAASRNPGAVVELDLGGSKDFVCETLVRCCTHIGTLRAVLLSVDVVVVVRMVFVVVVVARESRGYSSCARAHCFWVSASQHGNPHDMRMHTRYISRMHMYAHVCTLLLFASCESEYARIIHNFI